MLDAWCLVETIHVIVMMRKCDEMSCKCPTMPGSRGMCLALWQPSLPLAADFWSWVRVRREFVWFGLDPSSSQGCIVFDKLEIEADLINYGVLDWSCEIDTIYTTQHSAKSIVFLRNSDSYKKQSTIQARQFEKKEAVSTYRMAPSYFHQPQSAAITVSPPCSFISELHLASVFKMKRPRIKWSAAQKHLCIIATSDHRIIAHWSPKLRTMEGFTAEWEEDHEVYPQ